MYLPNMAIKEFDGLTNLTDGLKDLVFFKKIKWETVDPVVEL